MVYSDRRCEKTRTVGIRSIKKTQIRLAPRWWPSPSARSRTCWGIRAHVCRPCETAHVSWSLRVCVCSRSVGVPACLYNLTIRNRKIAPIKDRQRQTGAEKGGHAFPPLLPEKPKQRDCSPLHSAADDWQAILLGERKSVLPNAWHKSFLSKTLAGIDKPGVHLDSPIKMGKWSGMEALCSNARPLYPLALRAPWAALENDFLAYGSQRQGKQESG